MEYAIAGGVTAVFILLYLITRPRERDSFTSAMNEEDYIAYARETARSLDAPSDGGNRINAAPYKRKVGKALRRAEKECGDAELKRLYTVLSDRKEDIEQLMKKDFTVLQDLPGVKGRARCVLVAETVLERSRYIFCADRVEIAAEAFNAARTLTYSEIDAMQTAFEFVLLRKLAFLCERLTVTDDVRKEALRVAKRPRLRANTKKCKMMRGTVFSRFCAGEMGYDTEKFDKAYLALTDELAFYLNNVIDSLDNAAIFDFSVYYEPCGILARFDAYASAPAETRAAFAKKLGELSTAENLDEYAYAVRLENYGDYGKLSAVSVRRAAVGRGSAVLARFPGDLTTLARALSSPVFMQLIFGQSGKNESILKNVKIKSGFMPKSRVTSANFGINIKGDRLSVSPEFPPELEEAECVVVHKGVRHKVRIERGGGGVTVNGTLMTGVPSVTLGGIPLNIVFGIGQNID